MSEPLFGNQSAYPVFDGVGAIGDMQQYVPLISMGMMMLQGKLSGQGMVPLQFFGRTNAYEQLENMRYYQTGQAAMTASRELEASAHAKLAQQMAMLTGLENPQQYGIVGREASMFISPLMAGMAPEALSILGGSRGSPTVATQRMQTAGRHMLDPVTGRFGFSSDTLSAITEDLTEAFHPPDAGMRKNLPIDELASMLFEGTRRGRGPQLLRSQLSTQQNAELQKIMEQGHSQGLSAALGDALSDDDKKVLAGIDELDKFSPMEAVRKIDTERMRKWIESNQEVVRALKDIFGPDKPMGELMSAMDALTQNNAGGMDADQMTRQLRQFHEYGRLTNLGTQGMMQLTAAAVDAADRVDIGRKNVLELTKVGASANLAFQATNLSGVPKLNQDEFVKQNIELHAQAAGSYATSLLGAAARLADHAEKDSDLMKVVRGELPPPRDGSEFFKLATDSGVKPEIASAVLHETDLNLSVAQDRGLEHIARRRQWKDDMLPEIFSNLHSGTDRALSAVVGDADARFGFMTELTDSLVEIDTIRQMAKHGTGAAHIKQKIIDFAESQGTAVDDMLAGNLATMIYGNIYSKLGEFGYAPQDLVYHAPVVLDAQFRYGQYVTRIGELTRDMSGISEDSPLRRGINAIMEAKPGTTAMDLLAAITNVIPEKSLAGAAAPLLTAISETGDALRAQMAGATDWRFGQAMPDELKRADAEAGEQIRTMLGKGYGSLLPAARQLAEGFSLAGDSRVAQLALGRDAPEELTQKLRNDAVELFRSAAKEMQTKNFSVGIDALAAAAGTTQDKLLGTDDLQLSDEQIRESAALVAQYATGLGGVGVAYEDKALAAQYEARTKQVSANTLKSLQAKPSLVVELGLAPYLSATPEKKADIIKNALAKLNRLTEEDLDTLYAGNTELQTMMQLIGEKQATTTGTEEWHEVYAQLPRRSKETADRLMLLESDRQKAEKKAEELKGQGVVERPTTDRRTAADRRRRQRQEQPAPDQTLHVDRPLPASSTEFSDDALVPASERGTTQLAGNQQVTVKFPDNMPITGTITIPNLGQGELNGKMGRFTPA